MKKVILIFAVILLGIFKAYPQATPVGVLRIQTATTASNDGITQFEYGTGHYDLMGDNLSATAGGQTFVLSFTNSMGSTKYYALSCACFLQTSSLSPPKLLVRY